MRVLVCPARIISDFLADHAGDAKARLSVCHPPVAATLSAAKVNVSFFILVSSQILIELEIYDLSKLTGCYKLPAIAIRANARNALIPTSFSVAVETAFQLLPPFSLKTARTPTTAKVLPEELTPRRLALVPDFAICQICHHLSKR